MAAARLVKTGKVYRLGVETNSKTPAFGPRSWALAITQPGQVGGGGLGPTKTNYNDDIYMGYVGTGSQIDGLGHIGVDNVYYNCNKNSEFVQANGLTKLGIEKVPGIVTRGVLLDMTQYYGQNPVPEGTAYNRKEIDEQAKRQGVEIRKGDVVLFYSGWPSLVGKDDKRYISAEPGIGKEGAEYLASKQVVAIGADTSGLEAIPFEKGVGVFEIHHKAYEFMFTLGASRMMGGVQAIVNPIAIR
jgi:hypothetical protein